MSGTPSNTAATPAGGRGSVPQVKVEGGVGRLTSLRSTEATGGAARKLKFVPRVQKRAQQGESEPVEKASKPTFLPRGSTGDSGEYGGRGGRGGRGDGGGRGGRGGRGGEGRGAGRGGGRGGNRRANLPPAKVAFVGSMAAGSSVSSGGGVAKAKKQPQSTEVGISLLEDGIDDVHGADVEVPIQWPPPIESAMQPMELPFGRPPQHTNDAGGDVFCDETGAFVVGNDTLFFVQLPTTLPYTAPLSGVGKETASKSSENGTETRFDKSLSAMPGGYLGKVIMHYRRTNQVLSGGDYNVELD
ncbi:hypothetical protein, variant [Aphanomyces astaci]|uniref:Uncharacterized protein n=1 Tax=Aphanomyces astaci TaxID=112090 RepID=W4GPD8_APHAT|nr:hypothetical protein, variant [Aphanomyces astaci]ETV81547.1 hypothetical protein, variant [Aphanomyces astaci]|eukprot:XP_009829405.1 hypothetical protein, variant [Aphanomyces astaci]